MFNCEWIGKRFCELRNKCGITQIQIAQYLDVDQSYVLKCEKNESPFSVDILEKASELFGCNMDDFLDEHCELVEVPIALRAKGITTEDIKIIATMNKLLLNLRIMEDLYEGE